ncbi:MAG: NAD(P)H-dependent glycerol-3-phosphate dehydrogenase [Cyanobacteriota bacterium]|nr:NAD(P)H-dependent glycerol-3-phosphate dehydrogenase [Cyanobacteriota bacterium]
MASFPPPLSITILGSGAWGSTLYELAVAQGHRVSLWGRRRGDPLGAAVAGADLIVSAVSMVGVPSLVNQLQSMDIPPQSIVVTTTKGLDAVSLMTPAQIWQQAFPKQAIVVLSGPNLSKEIQQGLPTATVVASSVSAAAVTVQQAFSSERFRVYTSQDPLGVELGGTLKNVIAIAVGVCDGLHLGANAKAALTTRGLAEIIRIGTCLGAKPETFSGLSGVGDLLATCHSPLSRNYQVGYGLGQGKSLEQILADLEGTAEGINTTRVLVRLAEQFGIPVPISQQVYAVLQGDVTPQSALETLMERAVKPE